MYMLGLKNCNDNPFGLYYVEEGDTAESVGKKFALPPAFILAYNRLRVFPSRGGIVLLPRGDYTVYTVGLGETLESIAEKFKFSKEMISGINGCEYVYPTQKICLPK